MIEIDKIGIIISGDELGNQIKIIDDRESTGGYLILTGKELSNLNVEAFDNWVSSKHELNEYFKESHWKINWLN